MDCDVLVVGAGPTGLMLANQLARRGVRTLIIDRHAGPARETRALGVQARTLEIYAKLGVVDRALALGKRGSGANLWAEGRRMARVPLGDAGAQLSPYPYILVLGQDDNEKILGERLHDFGLSVRWNTELLALTQTPECATATLKLASGEMQEIETAWVAGCDGARSAVREQSGIGFPGASYEHVFFVADVQATGSMVPDEVNVYLYKDGFHLLFPMRGQDHWRLVGILPAALRDREGVRFDDVIPSVRKEAGAGLAFEGCSWFSTYRIHHRSASRFREGRAFVLGDAAHIHSPVGAQGMNTGLQDAYNLGWKLALVVQGQADEALLDSYEAERLPVARRLLDTTDRGFKLVVSDNWFAGLLRTEVLARVGALAMSRPRIQRMAFRVVSQIGIHYRASALSLSLDDPPQGAPRAGDRFPWLRLRFSADGPPQDVFDKLDDLHFHLLVFGQPAPQAPLLLPGERVRVHAFPPDPGNAAELARQKLPQLSFYLLRPDGHIALCGARLDLAALARHAAGPLGLRTLPLG
ncbi:FAD-dependent monooxygenase [Variovorax sp. RA8]|uniref:FAD-dependent monooxygenase n=1 Tax=Variovorax sp. (strain JCM 16519 / RA8) TaxID=662548 RepID=UPI0013174A4B|nr:FAD-dependent monooxygenase [Variovorax sp. RA8]VTU38308.1 Pentachlorophenol 4-monooxygenase [Variovorax sp. RA8]